VGYVVLGQNITVSWTSKKLAIRIWTVLIKLRAFLDSVIDFRVTENV
jgi:hypothetical protein